MSSRAISDLHPDVQPLVRKALADCAADGIEVLVTCTFRSAQEQTELYAQGRTKPGKIVTNAPAGKSSHNFRIGQVPAALAIDVVPMRFGKPVWGLSGDGIDNDPSDDDKDDLELWQSVRAKFEAVGLLSASRWKGRMVEWPHFEYAKAKEMMS